MHQNISAYAYLTAPTNNINSNTNHQIDQLVLLANQIDFKSVRHCIDFMYMDQYNAFIVLDADTLKIVYTTINTNHLRSLFSNAFRFRIEQTNTKVLDQIYFLEFANKIIKVGEFFVFHNASDVKIIWHANDLHFNQKFKQQTITHGDIMKSIANLALGINSPIHNNPVKKTVLLIKKICQSPQQISTVLFNPQLCILICGTSQGELKVYKINMKSLIATLPASKKWGRVLGQLQVQAKTQLLFKLSLHNYKSILNIQLYSPKIILTIGSDEYMQVISLDQMASIQRFKCDTNLSNIKFINNSLFLAIKTIQFDQFLYAYQVALNYQLLMQHNSQILHYIHIGTMSVLVLSDNSVNALQIDGYQARGKVKKRKIGKYKNEDGEYIQQNNNLPMLGTQSFVPPRCKSILAMQSYPYSNNNQQYLQFWILTDQSEIYQYKYKRTMNNQDHHRQQKSQSINKNKPFQIIGIHQMKYFKDSYGHETKYKVTKIKFIDITPVHYDSDIKQKYYNPNLSLLEQVKPIILGSETGEIIITSTLSINKIISRIRLFGQPVISIATAYYPQQLVDLNKYTHDDFEVSYEQNNGNFDKQNKVLHQRRLVVFSSYKQIICAIFSNCQIPQTIYKFMLATLPTIPKYKMNTLSKYFISIISSNTVKILFPSYQKMGKNRKQSIYKLKIWSPKIIIHEGPITCLQYCNNVQVISGDQLGKIVIWNLLPEILVTIVVTEAVSIQLAYFFNHSIIFGHHGKIFYMNNPKIHKNSPLSENKQKQLMQNENWIQQNTKQLSSKTNANQSRVILQMFKQSMLNKLIPNSNQGQQFSKIQYNFKNDKKNWLNSNKKQQSPQQPHNQHTQPFDKYVSNMKKSFIKLAHQVQGYNHDETKIQEKSKQKESNNKKKGITSRNRKLQRNSTMKIRSTAKKIQFSPQKTQKQGTITIQREEMKLMRAKSILNKFKEAQIVENNEDLKKTGRSLVGQIQKTKMVQKQTQKIKGENKNNEASISLPQIKNYSGMYKKQELSFREGNQMEEWDRKKKNRNKKYQFLFHFPKQGLYSQLISKNMLQ